MVWATLGCVVPMEEEPTAGELQALDLEGYAALVAELDRHRSEFLDEDADQLVGDGPNLFWLEYGGSWDPTVFVLEPGGGPTPITVLSFDDLNYRVDGDLLVTAVPDGGDLHYRAFDLQGGERGTTTVDAPTSGVAWWAHAPDRGQIYIVDESRDALLAFAPGQPPAMVTTFTDLGVDLGVFWDFDVDGDEMLFVESGRLWRADLAAGAADWLGNETEATAAVESDVGVVYLAAEGLFVVDDTGSTTDIGAALLANPYRINDTFTTSHHPGADSAFSVLGSVVVYIGQDGVFAYDLATDHVEPILLQPRTPDLRIDYRNPVVTSDGVLYVVGLESTSGAVGGDGPVYRVDHPYLLALAR